MHRRDKYSQLTSIIWSVLRNGWVVIYELNGCCFDSTCSHSNFIYCARLEQGVPWHSGSLWNVCVTWQEHTVSCTVRISTHNSAQSCGSLTKWLSVRLLTKWLWARIQLQALELDIWRLFWARSSLTLLQL